MKIFYVLLSSLLFPLFGAHDGEAPQKPNPIRNGKDYAVFFYVSDCDDRRWPSLPQTRTESEKIADELELNYGFTCEFVRNPTREQIREKIRAYNDRVYNPDDQVLFFFSMHGHYDVELDRGFLIARDGKIGDRYGDSWYSYDDLGTDLARSKCQHILLALDACHSGAFGIPNEKGNPGGPDTKEEPDCAKKISGFLQYKTRLYLCSGSKEAKTPGESLFAARWIEALRKGGDGGIVTTNDLQFHLGKITKPKYAWGRFKGHDGGDFVFVKKNTCGGSSPAVSNDRDGDGIPNAVDKCPDQYGIAEKNGCPDTGGSVSGAADDDFDGIANTEDACPDAYGTAKAKGCPDADDDGVPDKSDKCKYAAGLPRWEGCPDTDGDGLPDNTDQCPTEKGAVADLGCPPADRDRDGVPDKSDKCPDQAGKANREGCPDPEPIVKIPDDGLVLVPGGTFTMGCTSEQKDCYDDEKPTHQVTLSDFYIGKYEVTQKLWKDIMGNNPSTSSKDCDDCPVENVSWDDIQDFLQKLNAKNPRRNYRLPTEAEWEYAARGGSQSKGYLYAGSNDIGTVAWYSGNSGSKTQAVGKRKGNELGLYDMSGNVWEWCSDRYGDYKDTGKPVLNPTGADKGSYRVYRGGSWGNDARRCRVSGRTYSPGYRGSRLGFRLASSPQ